MDSENLIHGSIGAHCLGWGAVSCDASRHNRPDDESCSHVGGVAASGYEKPEAQASDISE